VISVIVETWNLGVRSDRVVDLLALLEPQIEATAAELVVTAERPPPGDLPAIARWRTLPPGSDYYQHKNSGAEAARGDVLAFIDGDCRPSTSWLEHLTSPILEGGARVVAGATSYPGPIAPLANQIDFPYFAGERGTVRNFFANNVAFTRELFSARPYPTIEPMFHGQCQVLGLRLVRERIPIHFAATATVTHAWPEGAREWLEVRLLRGADTAALLPHVLATYAPRLGKLCGRAPRLSALALLGLRGARATLAALRDGPRLRNLGFVAFVTALDSIGAAATPLVYRLAG